MSSTKEYMQPTHVPIKLRYRLYRLLYHQDQSDFYLEIRLGNERFLTSLHTYDRQKAKQIYTAMKKGKVTPCTAQDVLDDIGS